MTINQRHRGPGALDQHSVGQPLSASPRILLVVDALLPSVRDVPASVRHLIEANGTSVFVITPALNSRLGSLTSDSDAAVRRAHERLEEVMSALLAMGLAAEGSVGDEDPLLAIADVLRTRTIDQVVIVAHAADQENWWEGGVTQKARQQFGVPVTEVVVRKRAESPAIDPPS